MEENEFVSYSVGHFVPIVIILLVGVILSLYSKYKLSHASQIRMGVFLAIIPLLAVVIRICLRIYDGSFDYQEDLPFHLCNFIAILGPFIMYSKNRFWLGVFYFWVFVGTLNANLTPDLEFGFPHYSYFFYWLLHTGLLILPIYSILNYDLKIKWKDMWFALIGVNIYLIVSLIINFMLDSNYAYSRHKPPVASIIDYLGPWPWYLLTGQILAVMLCLLAIIPWLFVKKQQ